MNQANYASAGVMNADTAAEGSWQKNNCVEIWNELAPTFQNGHSSDVQL